MSDSEIVNRYTLARAFILKLGYRRHADDFAGWHVMKLLEGKSQKQSLKFSFYDYLRSHIKANAPTFVHVFDVRRWEKIFAPIPSCEEEVVLDLSIKRLIKKQTPKRQQIWHELTVNGLSQVEVARLLGQTEGAITRNLEVIKKGIKRGLRRGVIANG